MGDFLEKAITFDKTDTLNNFKEKFIYSFYLKFEYVFLHSVY